MNGLIDKEKLMEELKQLRNHYIYDNTGLPSQAINDAMVIVTNMNPERIAIWREKHDAIDMCFFVCSNCGCAIREDEFYKHTPEGWIEIPYNYCPQCGRTMTNVDHKAYGEE